MFITKHTKGDWKIQACVPGDTYKLISPRTKSAEEHFANARLMSASPELLEACMAQWEANSYFGPSDVKHRLQVKAQRLINKALDKAVADIDETLSVEKAANKAMRTGSKSDLQEYLRLHRKFIGE